MEISVLSIVSMVTIIVTYVFGIITKRFDLIETNLIPLQNAFIGIAAGFLCYALKIDGMDLCTSLGTCLVASFSAGGMYDAINLKSGGSEDGR